MLPLFARTTRYFAAVVVLLHCFTSSAAEAQSQHLQTSQPFALSRALLDSAIFTQHTEHTGAGAFDNYLVMNLPFAPINALRKAIDSSRLASSGSANIYSLQTAPLLHRGEAHITVITPPEYASVLQPWVSMKDINAIATRLRIQSSAFVPLCVGRAELVLGNEKNEKSGTNTREQTYFVVIRSEALLAIRRAVFALFVERGGEPSRWDPDHFYPHITVGFTKRDFHEEGDGVHKGVNACLQPIRVE